MISRLGGAEQPRQFGGGGSIPIAFSWMKVDVTMKKISRMKTTSSMGVRSTVAFFETFRRFPLVIEHSSVKMQIMSYYCMYKDITFPAIGNARSDQAMPQGHL